jgi:tungstate transport system ATP-binding protein
MSCCSSSKDVVVLSARHLEHRYDGRTVLAVEALDLEAGRITGVVGPNGAGKSTLLRVLAFLERPHAGTLILDGHPVRTSQDRRLARQAVTLVEQRPFVFPGTVHRNLLYGLSLHGITGRDAAARAEASLSRLGASAMADRAARQLSEGEVQRVAIARAIALQPAVLLLDEPVSGADRGALTQLYQVLDEERRRGAAIGFVSHQLEYAYRWANRVFALTDGRLSPLTPDNLFRTTLSEAAGPQIVRAGPLEIEVVTDKSGPATLLIPPEDIVVSREPLHSSARNQYTGRVTRISDDGRGGVTLTVDVGVDLSARITREALDELEIQLGTELILSVKAMAVRVF